MPAATAAHEIITLAEARELGLKRYFTGQPCKHGHIGQRYVSSSGCSECINAQHRARRAKNPEVVRARDRARHAKNPEVVRAQQRARRAKNLEAVRARQRAWHVKNLEARNAQKRVRYAKNPESTRKVAREQSRHRRARKLRQHATVSPNIELNLMLEQGSICAALVCLTELTTDPLNFHVDHITPLSKNGIHTDANLQLLCVPCNLSKHDTHPDDWEPLVQMPLL